MDEVMEIAITQRTAVEKQIAAEDDDETKPATFLVQLLRNQIKNPSSITDREINSHTFGNIIAGGDTTATALRGIIRNIARNPEIGQRIRAELFKAGITTGDQPVPYAVASKLPYLAAVVKESMRLHPSVGMMLARGVPQGGAVLRSSDGKEYSLGSGTEIGINPWIIHRDPEIFPDPDSFTPERWLDATSEKLARMNKFWIPFGAGRHSCSGQHISMLEMTKLIPTLVLRYDMTWAEGAPDIGIKNYFFTLQSGLRVNLRQRG
jgi:cytochrome P450